MQPLLTEPTCWQDGRMCERFLPSFLAPSACVLFFLLCPLSIRPAFSVKRDRPQDGSCHLLSPVPPPYPLLSQVGSGGAGQAIQRLQHQGPLPSLGKKNNSISGYHHCQVCSINKGYSWDWSDGSPWKERRHEGAMQGRETGAWQAGLRCGGIIGGDGSCTMQQQVKDKTCWILLFLVWEMCH